MVEGPEEIVEEQDLILIKDILKSLSKALKIFKAYPQNNPIYQKFARELHEKFNLFFEGYDSIPLTVEQFSLSFKGKEVFNNKERTDNIALMLFVDGIREISFKKDMTMDELIGFVDIFRIVSEGKNLEDDIVTLLWERNFEHIGYSVSEWFVEDDLLLKEEPLLDEASGERIPFGATYIDVLIPSGLDFKIAPLKPDELASLKEESEKIEGDTLLIDLLELFFETITAENDIEDFRGFAENIGKIIDIMLSKGSLKKAAEIIERLRNLIDSVTIQGYKDIINKVIDSAGDEERIKGLLGGERDLEDLQAYLSLLNKNAIKPLLDILGGVEDRKVRRVVCNALSIIGKQDIETFARGIHDKRWYVVRNILMIFGMMDDPRVLSYVKEGLRHPEPRVRKEAIKTLGSIGSEEIKWPLIGALKDKDSSVRIEALKILRRFEGEGLFETLKEIVLKTDFIERSFTEKKEFLETLGETGKEKAFPILSRFFKRRGLFRSIEREELRASAAYGLGLIGSKEAIALLEKGSRKRGIIGDACKEALIKVDTK